MRDLVGHLLVAGIHVVILSTLFIMIILTFKLVNDSPSLVERNLRYLALAGGLLMFFAADTLKVDLATLISQSLALVYPGNVFIAKFAIPSAAGTLAAWFLIQGLQERQTSSRAVKLLVMLTAFLLFTFADLYAASISAKNREANLYLLPNVSFVLSIVLYSVFRYKVVEKEIAPRQSAEKATPRTLPADKNWRGIV